MISLKDININEIFHSQTQILYVYQGTNEIWPGSPINNSGFLKYYSGNFKQEFRTVITNSTGEYDQALVYKSYNFSTEFQGPDTGINIWVKSYDDYLNYDSGNISVEFNNFVDTGEYDQDLDYNSTNMQTEFIAYEVPVDPTAVYDQPISYKTNFNTEFLGPDTGINPWVKSYDDYMVYDSSNISVEFNSFIDAGEYDQDIDYNSTNMQTEFIQINYNGDPTAVYDQFIKFSNSNFATEFLGPDTGINIWTPNYLQYQKYNSSNIKDSFVGPGSTGLFDFNLVYSFSNIQNNFLPN